MLIGVSTTYTPTPAPTLPPATPTPPYSRASQLYIYEDISKAGVVAIKERLREIILTDAWLTLQVLVLYYFPAAISTSVQEPVVLELVEDINLKVTEGELFAGMVKWCRSVWLLLLLLLHLRLQGKHHHGR